MSNTNPTLTVSSIEEVSGTVSVIVIKDGAGNVWTLLASADGADRMVLPSGAVVDPSFHTENRVPEVIDFLMNGASL